MAKNSAQAQTEKPEAQKGGAAKMPIFPTKFDGSGSDNTDEFRRTLIGHVEHRAFVGPRTWSPPCPWLVFGLEARFTAHTESSPD